MKKVFVLFGVLVLCFFLACSSKDDAPAVPEISKRPTSLFVETSEGYSWTFRYSYSGNLITKLTSSAGETANFEYDSNDRLQYLLGFSSRTTYSYTDGKLSSIQYKDNRDYIRTTNFTYNSLGQVSSSTTQVDDRETIYNYMYDSRGRLFEITDAFGGSEKYLYDDANHIFKNVYPQMGPQNNFAWISPQTNNVVSHVRSFADNLRYEYIYDSDNYPILVKEFGSNGEVNTTTTITYEE